MECFGLDGGFSASKFTRRNGQYCFVGLQNLLCISEQAFRKKPRLCAQETDKESGTRCGHVAIIGKSNVGKSTLMNHLVGEKIAIVTPKVQTTRNRIVGIATEKETQIIFLDTPGIFNPKLRFDRAMVDSAWTSAAEADMIALMFDLPQFKARKMEIDKLHEEIKSRITAIQKKRSRDVILIMNKVDLMTKKDAASASDVLSEFFSDVRPVDQFAISATRGDSVQDLKNCLADTLPEGPWLYPDDEMTTLPARLMAAEVTREKVFLQLKQELPYSVAVDTIAWEEYRNGSVRIDQEIFVQRQSQKGIVMGKNGTRIKALGVASREDIEELLGRKVHLFLHVKVRSDWQDRRDMYLPWGLNYNA